MYYGKITKIRNFTKNAFRFSVIIFPIFGIFGIGIELHPRCGLRRPAEKGHRLACFRMGEGQPRRPQGDGTAILQQAVFAVSHQRI